MISLAAYWRWRRGRKLLRREMSAAYRQWKLDGLEYNDIWQARQDEPGEWRSNSPTSRAREKYMKSNDRHSKLSNELEKLDRVRSL